MQTEALTLPQLAERTHISKRQLRELIRLRVLPPACSQGRGATYSQDHLDRARAWKRIRRMAPPTTRTADIKALIEHLSETPELLHAIAEGSIPFQLVDDQQEGSRIASVVGPLTTSGVAGLKAREPSGHGANDQALQYLAGLPSEQADQEGSLQLSPKAAAESAARIPLDRLIRALQSWVAGDSPTARVRPVPIETWHRLAFGPHLVIEARCDPGSEELELLKAVGDLLQRAIHKREAHP